MGKLKIAVLILLSCSVGLNAADKQKGTTKLTDLQPAGTTDKNNKNQIYDFHFTNAGNSYTCRTNRDTKLKATDFIVGDDIRFELDGDNAKLKNPSGKETKCKVVRVEKVAAGEK
jgi:hypothetical protein